MVYEEDGDEEEESCVDYMGVESIPASAEDPGGIDDRIIRILIMFTEEAKGVGLTIHFMPPNTEYVLALRCRGKESAMPRLRKWGRCIGP